MSFVRHTSLHQAYAERAARAPQQIDLDPCEWEELDDAGQPASDGHELRTIASFWILAVFLLAVIVAAPALQVAAHHLT